MPRYSEFHRHLILETPLGPDALLVVGFSGQESMSQLFHYRLDLVAENSTPVAFDKLLGEPVTIHVALPGGIKRRIKGIVSRFGQGKRDKIFTSFRMEVVPRLWLLTKKVRSRIFQHLSIPDILKKVLEGLDVVYQIQGTFHPRDYCVQYRESDFNFISRLMEEEGIYSFFKHTDNGDQLVLANTPQSHPALPEGSSLLFEETLGGTRPDDRVLDWEKTQEMRAGKVTLWDHSFELPYQNLEASQAIQESVKVGQVVHKLKVGGNDMLEVYDYPGGFANRFAGIDRGGGEQAAELQKIFEDNKRTAGIRMQQEALGSVAIKAASTIRHLQAGHKFSLTRHFNADGDYVITGVEQSAELTGDFRSGDITGMKYENKFTCVPLELPFRPVRQTTRPTVLGTQTATVVGPEGDDQVFTDKHGRVKVQFHWDREGKKDPDSSCWVRVGTNWAGKGFGFVTLPRIGQEVIVDFLEGDPDKPIIIGSVYNADQVTPFNLPADRKLSGIVSQSNPARLGKKSNQIYIDDTHDKEVMKFRAERIMDIEVGKDRYIQVYGADLESVHGMQDITILSDQTSNILGDQNITIQEGKSRTTKITGSDKHEIDGLESFKVKGPVTIESGSVISLKADAFVDLQVAGHRILIDRHGALLIIADGQPVRVTGSEVLLNC